MMKNIFYPAVILLSFSVFTIGSEFNVKKSEKNQVKFISDAPIEDFEGVTNNIDGYLFYENEITNKSQLYFEVDLRTLDTGIGLRNRHMRENYLETDKFPIAAYTGMIYSAERIGENKFNVIVKGEMNIHGITRNQEVKGVVEITAKGVRITANFIVKLTDHKIDVPSLMFMKIDENMDLQLDFYLAPSK